MFSWKMQKRNHVQKLTNAWLHNNGENADRSAKRAWKKFRRHFTLRKLILGLLWITVFTIGIFLTVLMGVPLIEIAIENPVVTAMKVVVNQSMTLPIQPVLCISMVQLYASELWYQQLYDAEWVEPPPEIINDEWPLVLTKIVDVYFTYKDLKHETPEYAVSVLRETYNLTDDNILRQQWSDNLDRLYGESSQNAYQEAVTTYFTEHKENITGAIFGTKWKPSWLFIVFSCLNIATKCEIGGAYTNKCHLSPVDYKSGYTFSHRLDRVKACIQLEKRLRSVHVTTEELRQQFGIQILKIYRTWTGIRTNTNKMVDVFGYGTLFRRTVSISSAAICYEINPTVLMSYSDVNLLDVFYSDYGVDYISPHQMPFLAGEEKLSLALVFNGFERDQFGDGHLISFTGIPDAASEFDIYQQQYLTASSAYSDEPFCVAEIRHTISVMIKLTAVYRYIEEITKGERRCSRYPSFYNCFRDCKINAIQQALNCTPTSLNPPINPMKNPTNLPLPECTIEALTSNNRSNENVSEIVDCTQQCPRPCEDWRISVDQKGDQVLDKYRVGISYRFAIQTYTMYEEVHSVSLQGFAGDLGGILGLWLGIDLILVTQCIILFGQCFFSFLRRLFCCYSMQSQQMKCVDGIESQTPDDFISTKETWNDGKQAKI